jgi:hypothetical protein
MSDGGISHILIKKIDYDSFHAIEKPSLGSIHDGSAPSATLWETIVRALMEGYPTGTGPSGSCPDEIDPAELAAALNKRFHEDSREKLEDFTARIEEYLGQLLGRPLWRGEGESFARMGELLKELKPDLRRQFLEKTFLSLAEKGVSPTVSGSGSLDGAVITVLEDINANGAQLPSLLIDLMQKLSESVNGDGPKSDEPARDPRLDSDVEEKLRTLFSEEKREEFVPTTYLETLKSVVFCRLPEENELEDRGELKTILEHECLESAVSSIIVESFSYASDEQKETLRQNLFDICHHFLDTGDFSSLRDLYRRLSTGEGPEGKAEDHLGREIRTFFAQSGFLEKTLDGLSVWGKGKYAEIGRLIQTVGKAFVDPLLDRLAGEESMSLRRYYLGQLIQMAGIAKESVLARLDDPRWYFLRNLVIILQHSNDPDILAHVSRLARHGHPLVRQKVRETYFHYGDPAGERLILEDMGSSDRETRLNAVQLAEKCRSPEVVTALLDILRQKGMSVSDLALKQAAVAALAEIGDGRALPVLELILRKRPLFRRKVLIRLKADIVGSLHRYRDQKARELLAWIARSGDPELAALARQTMNSNGGES